MRTWDHAHRDCKGETQHTGLAWDIRSWHPQHQHVLYKLHSLWNGILRAHFSSTSVDGKLFGVSLNSGTDSLLVTTAATRALTISEAGYTSGPFPPSGTKNTHTSMLQTEETVHGTTSAELSEGIADLIPIAFGTICRF